MKIRQYYNEKKITYFGHIIKHCIPQHTYCIQQYCRILQYLQIRAQLSSAQLCSHTYIPTTYNPNISVINAISPTSTLYEYTLVPCTGSLIKKMIPWSLDRPIQSNYQIYYYCKRSRKDLVIQQIRQSHKYHFFLDKTAHMQSKIINHEDVIILERTQKTKEPFLKYCRQLLFIIFFFNKLDYSIRLCVVCVLLVRI